MDKYLERLEKGEDSKTLILEVSEELSEAKKVINSVLDRVLIGGDFSSIATDIVSAIPSKFIDSDGDI